VTASRAVAPWPGGRSVAGRRAVAEAIATGDAVEVLIARGAHPTQGLVAVRGAAGRAGVPIREVSRAELDGLARDHRGVVARLRSDGDTPTTLSERDLDLTDWADDAVVVVLDGIEDPQNLGAAARAAEAAGAAALVTRTHRGAPVTDAAIRASAGALLHLPHARVANISRAVERLQGAGFTVVGLDGAADRSIFDEPCPGGRVVIAVGSEGTGLSRLVRERCDLLVRLPMCGRVGSLNAAASLAAALYAYVLPRATKGSG
jgi:23S rRNA (guanosine2251-2'-O)-methyltransferase